MTLTMEDLLPRRYGEARRDRDRLRRALKAARDYVEGDARCHKYPLSIQLLAEIDAALGGQDAARRDA